MFQIELLTFCIQKNLTSRWKEHVFLGKIDLILCVDVAWTLIYVKKNSIKQRHRYDE